MWWEETISNRKIKLTGVGPYAQARAVATSKDGSIIIAVESTTGSDLSIIRSENSEPIGAFAGGRDATFAFDGRFLVAYAPASFPNTAAGLRAWDTTKHARACASGDARQPSSN